MALPVADFILVVNNEIDKGTSESDVGLLPGGIGILLQLKNLETIEVDGVDGLLLPFLVKHGLRTPGEHAEAVSDGLYVQ